MSGCLDAKQMHVPVTIGLTRRVRARFDRKLAKASSSSPLALIAAVHEKG
jgi:hypothetical protein